MAADLLQEVFLRLHRFAERIDPSRPLQPWLYRMTVNLSYTWIKRKSRWMRYINEMAERIVTERRPASPHNLAERDESWHWVRQAILALPVQQRMVVVLYYINDLSLKEISEILELFEQIAHKRDNPFLWLNLALTIIRWSFRNLVLEPIDIALQPVLYFSDVDLYPTYVTHKGIHHAFIC
jgi:RNA polymerase sigma-70 factor (ECF subfamily)